MSNAFAEAIRQPGNTGVRLLPFFWSSGSMRWSLRAGFVRTIYAARQAVTQGRLRVNGQKVDRPDFGWSRETWCRWGRRAKIWWLCRPA